MSMRVGGRGRKEEKGCVDSGTDSTVNFDVQNDVRYR